MPYARAKDRRTNARKWYAANKDRYRRWRQKQKVRQQRTRKLIAKYKEKNPCADCRGHFPAAAMDFDHIKSRGKKHKIISKMVSDGYGLSRILAEIEKCDLVCATCHRVRELKRSKCATK